MRAAEAPAAEAAPAPIVVRDLRKRYGRMEALRGVSFEVRQGEVFGLIGPNGAGKTTTLECLLGLREPDAGEVRVCGIDARREPRSVKSRVGAALQTTALHDQITPREALELFGSLYPRRADPDELLERFSLSAHAEAGYHTLSGGQRQRLALALAFVNRPELLFLDEPTAGLDPQARRELHEEIRRMRRDGFTVLLTTHYIEEAERLCDRIAIIDHGRVLATGTPAELVSRSAAPQRVTLATARPLEAALLADLPGVRELEQRGTRVGFLTSSPSHTLAALMERMAAHEVEPLELQLRRATLEEVLIELTGPDLRD